MEPRLNNNNKKKHIQTKIALFTRFDFFIEDYMYVVRKHKQEGQHPLTGQRAPPISGGT